MVERLHPSFPADLEEQGVVPVGLPVKMGEVHDPPARALLSGFQSLGDDCEFGLTQRRYGAEHLALLRWVTLQPETLVSLLDRRLEGLGHPDRTDIYAAPWGELMAHDLTYGIRMHSFVQKDGVDLARFKANHCRRMDFLKAKLIEDLTLGEKLFVFNGGAAMTESLAARLQASLQPYGKAILLAVGVNSAADPAGTVRVGAGGVLQGYLSRRGKTPAPGGHRWDIDFDGWVRICGTASLLAALT